MVHSLSTNSRRTIGEVLGEAHRNPLNRAEIGLATRNLARFRSVLVDEFAIAKRCGQRDAGGQGEHR
jgi:hypothetical protein